MNIGGGDVHAGGCNKFEMREDERKKISQNFVAEVIALATNNFELKDSVEEFRKIEKAWPLNLDDTLVPDVEASADLLTSMTVNQLLASDSGRSSVQLVLDVAGPGDKAMCGAYIYTRLLGAETKALVDTLYEKQWGSKPTPSN